MNSFVYGAFENIAWFYSILGDDKKATYWTEHASNIKKTIDDLLWNEEDGTWYDYDTKLLQPRKHFIATNLAPLWTNAYDSGKAEKLVKRSVDYLRREGITEFPGGIPATTARTGEQWDFPNAWPPLQSIVVMGLQNSGVAEGQKLAKEFAEKWVTSNMIGYYQNGGMFEKYDAENAGQPGGGGEYVVQTGFGWANGVALEFIDMFYTGS